MNPVSGYLENMVRSTACNHCPAVNFCWLLNTHLNRANRVSRIRDRSHSFVSTESIYLHGEVAASVYLVCDGLVKTETETREGEVQVTDFYLPGEFLGLEGLTGDHYPVSAIACVNSRVRGFSSKELFRVCGENPDLLQEVFDAMGKRLRSDGCKWKVVRNEAAYFRVLFFLCDLLARQQGRSVPVGVVSLQMEKRDISSFLGMAPASLSRELRKLEADGLIRRLPHARIQIEESAMSILEDFV